ncbi:MAG TPA: GTP cyclohydrolase I FolE, partial [Spirochaetota bacterium]|nr:GTP cyclohydrolase I FolE [Spirochaetota bacterium]
MRDIIRDLIVRLGEDPEREGLKRTPMRVEKSYEFLTMGYKQNLDDIVNNALFQSENNEMIIVKDIEFYSLCEHHLLPFYGKCHIAYIPDKTIIGLSKLARVVDHFARRLQIQERLTTEISESIEKVLRPMGVGVVIE